MTAIKGSIKPLEDYKIYCLNSYVNIGECLNTAKTFGVVAIIDTLLSTINLCLSQKKARKVVDNKISYNEKDCGVNVTANVVVIANLLMILITFIKILLRKICNGNKQR